MKDTATGTPFSAGTGMMNSTQPGQRVTAENAHWLPPGSVTRLDDGGRLIHLHDGLWLWCDGSAHAYNSLERHLWRLPGMLCHLPPNTTAFPPEGDLQQLKIELVEAKARIAKLEAEIRNAISSSLNLWGEPITALQGLARLVRLPEGSGETPGSEPPS